MSPRAFRLLGVDAGVNVLWRAFLIALAGHTLLGLRPASAQPLDLPPRPASSLGGSEIALAVGELSLEAREERLLAEVARGNVPSWLRRLVPVVLESAGRSVTIRVTPDYLAVGSDSDYLVIPLTPQTAQRIADLTGTSLPTPAIVDAVWRAARLRVSPLPIPPSDEMTTLSVFLHHNDRVRRQRAVADVEPGVLVAGHKKDVVLTPRLDGAEGRVAIYGWHRLNGQPIQPLYLGHTDRWVDYSHGIRLVHRSITIDGARHDLLDVLADPLLAHLLSAEGPIRTPRYDSSNPVRGAPSSGKR